MRRAERFIFLDRDGRKQLAELTNGSVVSARDSSVANVTVVKFRFLGLVVLVLEVATQDYGGGIAEVLYKKTFVRLILKIGLRVFQLASRKKF